MLLKLFKTAPGQSTVQDDYKMNIATIKILSY